MKNWFFPKIGLCSSRNEIHNVCKILQYMEIVLPRWLSTAIFLYVYMKARQFVLNTDMSLDITIVYIGFFIFSFLIILNLSFTKIINFLEDPFVLKHYKKILNKNNETK